MTGTLVLAFVGWMLAAFLGGLWLGERGRRRGAEQMLVTGLPDTDTPPPAVTKLPVDAEKRFAESAQAFSDETIERGVESLKEKAQAMGIRVDEKELRADVERMLAGQDVP